METYNKDISKQDAGIKISRGGSNETSINLSNEIATFLVGDYIGEKQLTFTLFHNDFVKSLGAISVLATQKPLYLIGGGKISDFKLGYSEFDKLYRSIVDFFGNEATAQYTVTIYRREDGRNYLKTLSVAAPNGKKFNIRDFLVEKHSFIHFEQTESGDINLHVSLKFDSDIIAIPPQPLSNLSQKQDASYSRYLAAMRTKPFLLLAGISGTGKSRIVKEMAFASCPPSLRDADQVSPGNYCMIEVKPNWHDSTELMGYVSRIGGEHYVVTPFINFLIKAWHNPKAPFFVCLDEMNLAPVEQYFAEFLSVLESRKLNNGEIVSEPLVKAEYTSKYIEDFENAYSGKKLSGGYRAVTSTSDPAAAYGTDIFAYIAENGLRLPPNVIVVGTVNMDETTYQFSRKVIDRAMTIEMNEVDFDAMFTKDTDTLKYADPCMGAEFFLPKYTAAKDALEVMGEEDRNVLQTQLPALLKQLDTTLRTTPFRVAYRVENELILYFTALREEQPDADASQLLTTAMDDVLMMKVLPRIEGNEDTLEQPLKELADFTAERYLHATEKINEMQERLKANHFTSFWP